MIIIMKQGTTHEHVEELSQHIERWNVKANPIYGEDTIVIGLVGDTGAVDKDALMLDPQVENIIKVQEPFKLANRKFHPDNSVVEIAPGVVVGGKKLVVMAGPCSVENEAQIVECAERVKAAGASKRWGDKVKVTKDKKAELDTAFEACMMDGEVTVYALAEYMDLKPRTIKTRLKDDGRFWIDGEKVGRKEPGSAG